MPLRPCAAIFSALIALLLPAWPAGVLAEAPPLWQQTPEQIREQVSVVRAGRDLTPQAWPGGARVAVGLSFDVDTELVWLAEGGRQSPATMARGEYGARAGLRRVLAVLERHQVPASFFIPAMTMELHPDVVPMIRASSQEGPDHEFGFHSYVHEYPLELDPADERAAYEKGLALFEKHVGHKPAGFRSAAWDLTPATIGIVRALGFRYESSMMADDRPYELLAGGEPTGLVELPVEWMLDDWPYFQLDWDSGQVGLRDPDEVYRIWLAEFEGAWEEGTLFILTMHPQVIGHRHRIGVLDRLIGQMKSRPGVWFATHAEIAEHVSDAAAGRP